MKKCTKCKLDKPETEFCRDRSRSDGLHCWCTKCIVESNARYNVSPKGRAYQARYRALPEAKAARKRQRERHPDRIRARNAVTYAIQSGKIPPAKNLSCVGKHDPPVQAAEYHHKGYEPEYWLDVIPVCLECHQILTKRIRIAA